MSNLNSNSKDILLAVREAESLALMLADPIHTVRSAEGVDALVDVLSLARIVPSEAVRGGVVAMERGVTYEELPRGERRSVVLAYPIHADPSLGRISVLSPVGRALLGRRVGTIVDVALPSGITARLRICEVHPATRQGACQEALNA